MRVVHHASGTALLAGASPLLEASEAENGLLLALCAAPLVHDGGSAPKPPPDTAGAALWMSVEGDAGPVAVAIRTPLRNLILSRASAGAVHALASDLAARDVALPGVTSVPETARGFAEEWTRLRGLRAEVTMRQALYQLTSVVPPERPPRGALRAPRPAEVPMLSAWMRSFAHDAGLPPAEHEVLASRLPVLVEGGALFVWDVDGAPVSMAATAGKTRHGARVSYVYTPADFRGRGYASACVAALSAQVLASGRRFCTLYADIDNPTSNGIYQRLGYRRIGDYEMLGFS
jgi:predicted GNAT family acetyltransferase